VSNVDLGIGQASLAVALAGMVAHDLPRWWQVEVITILAAVGAVASVTTSTGPLLARRGDERRDHLGDHQQLDPCWSRSNADAGSVVTDSARLGRCARAGSSEGSPAS
jgi:hypothetical protein